MTKDLEYSASLTGAAFSFLELKKVLKLKQQGLLDSEIRKKVFEENLFQYEVKTSMNSVFPSVMRRANALDDVLQQMVIEGRLEMGKVINLYSIMKTDRLFFEFMNETVREKLEINHCLLERKDINLFFTAKSEQSEKMTKWTEKTMAKLKQVYIKLLVEAGMIKDKKTGELNRLIIDERLKFHLQSIGDYHFLRAMGE
jgi:hypothetical protein